MDGQEVIDLATPENDSRDLEKSVGRAKRPRHSSPPIDRARNEENVIDVTKDPGCGSDPSAPSQCLIGTSSRTPCARSTHDREKGCDGQTSSVRRPSELWGEVQSDDPSRSTSMVPTADEAPPRQYARPGIRNRRLGLFSSPADADEGPSRSAAHHSGESGSASQAPLGLRFRLSQAVNAQTGTADMLSRMNMNTPLNSNRATPESCAGTPNRCRNRDHLGAGPRECRSRLQDSGPARDGVDEEQMDDEQLAMKLQYEEDQEMAREVAGRLDRQEDERMRARMEALDALESAHEQATASRYTGDDYDDGFFSSAMFDASSRRGRSPRPTHGAARAPIPPPTLMAGGAVDEDPFGSGLPPLFLMPSAPYPPPRDERRPGEQGPHMPVRASFRAYRRAPSIVRRGVGPRGAMRELPIGRVLMNPDLESSLVDMFSSSSHHGLPPSLLFSDRDFTADDYEVLSRLDDTVENRKGASQQEIDALPTETVEDVIAIDDGGAGDGALGQAGPTASEACTAGRCSICLEDVSAGAVLRSLPCKHKFHKGCLDTWLRQKACCPICQSSCKP